MSPQAKRNLAFLGGLMAVAGILLTFPRVLAFVELASRELRYLWWLVLLLIVAVWLAFFFGRRER
jgi:hypothetical protein